MGHLWCVSGRRYFSRIGVEDADQITTDHVPFRLFIRGDVDFVLAFPASVPPAKKDGIPKPPVLKHGQASGDDIDSVSHGLLAEKLAYRFGLLGEVPYRCARARRFVRGHERGIDILRETDEIGTVAAHRFNEESGLIIKITRTGKGTHGQLHHPDPGSAGGGGDFRN